MLLEKSEEGRHITCHAGGALPPASDTVISIVGCDDDDVDWDVMTNLFESSILFV